MALSKHGRTAAAMAGVAAVTGALAWAAVPVGNILSGATGVDGATSIAEVRPNVVLERTVKARFDGTLAGDRSWTFGPVEPAVAGGTDGKHPGAKTLSYSFFEVHGDPAPDADRVDLAPTDTTLSNEL